MTEEHKDIFLSQKLCETLRLCVRINNIVCESLRRLREAITHRKDSVSSCEKFSHAKAQRAQRFMGTRNTRKDTEFLTEVLNWRPQNESKNNNFSNACISTVISLLYRRTKEHNALRPLRLCVR